MDKLYYILFFLALPIMCLLSYSVMAVMWLFGDRKEEAKRLLAIGVIGAIVGYIIAIIYFYITRSESFLALLDLGLIGLLVGSGYSMILFLLLPKKIRLRGVQSEGQ